MKISTQKINKVFLISLFIPFIFLIYALTIKPEPNWFFFTNLLILFFCYLGSIILDYEKSFSLVKVYFIYSFIFFGFMPLHELSTGILYWSNQIEAQYNTKVLANWIILIAIIFFYIGKHIKVNFIENVILRFTVFLRFKTSVYFFILILFLGLYLYFNDFEILFYRKDIFIDKNYKSTAEFLFYQNIVLSLIFILLIISYNHMKECSTSTRMLTISKAKTIFFVVFLIAIIFCNPLSLSRFQVAIYYMPILFYFKIFNKPSLFFFFFIFSILFVMPILDFFRYYGFDNIQNLNFFNLDHINAGHFDGYQNFTLLLENNFSLNGQNIFTSIFWFIPRSIFENKSVGSGELLANLLDLNFTNIAISFLGESYLALGLSGSIVFMLFIGIVLGNLDSVAWKFILKKKRTTFLYYYYFLFGQIFYLLRGDLLSSFSFMSSFLLTFVFVLLVFKIKIF